MTSWTKRPDRSAMKSTSAGNWASRCPDLQAQAREAQTVLTGSLADQAALYGLLAQIEALGLELLEVRRLDA
jgi:hypothetical protein